MNSKLEQIKAALRHTLELDAKATPGPWKWDGKDAWHIGVSYECELDSHLYTGIQKDERLSKSESFQANAAFITYARTFAPAAARALLTAIEGLDGLAKLGGGRSQGNCDAQHALETICREWSEDVK